MSETQKELDQLIAHYNRRIEDEFSCYEFALELNNAALTAVLAAEQNETTAMGVSTINSLLHTVISVGFNRYLLRTKG